MAAFRLFRVCMSGVYSGMFAKFVSGLSHLGFDASLQACREHGFLYPGRLKPELEELGVEVFETLVDVAAIQEKWLAEAGEAVDGPYDADWQERVLFLQLAAFRPDVVYFQSLFPVSHEARKRIKAQFPSIKLVVGHRGFPCFDCADYADVDAMFLGYPRHHEHWHAHGVRTFNSNHCFDEGLVPAIERGLDAMPERPFTFIGTTGYGFVNHDGRYYDLLKVMNATNLEVWGNERIASRQKLTPREKVADVLARMPMSWIKALQTRGGNIHPYIGKIGKTLEYHKTTDYWFYREKPIGQLFPDRMHPAVFGIEYFQLLARSKVTWNRHLEMDGAGANMRLYEACGAGACQLVDLRDEVTREFAPDREVVVYRSIEECIDKARWLLDNDAERMAIAAAGRARVLRDHSAARRARDVYDGVLSMLG